MDFYPVRANNAKILENTGYTSIQQPIRTAFTGKQPNGLHKSAGILVTIT
ncbi:hypothetical protein GL2_41440 [Microbulbifer sp. GL-2]|nr:hypothetical protein GL2_41440 [Microbulbifer sp. GL-2]